jgi:hypothetical protein
VRQTILSLDYMREWPDGETMPRDIMLYVKGRGECWVPFISTLDIQHAYLVMHNHCKNGSNSGWCRCGRKDVSIPAVLVHFRDVPARVGNQESWTRVSLSASHTSRVPFS